MNLELGREGALAIAGAGIELANVCPLVNGASLAGPWAADADSFRFALPAGIFRLRADSDQGRLVLRYQVENFPARMPLQRFGLRIGSVKGHRAFLRHGYFSWDGSYFLRPEDDAAAQSVTGYAMTQLLARNSAAGLVVGFDRHDRFQQTFTFGNHGGVLDIQTAWDEKDAGGGDCVSERLHVIVHGADVEGALRTWARLVAEHAPVPPRVLAERITGWCSWYNLYAAITEENIRHHLHGARAIASRERLPMRIFQLDDGFTPEMGDWLEVKPQFPRGLKPLLDEIRATGFRPGLWIAPFMVGNRSRLFALHPDWVVRDRTTGGPLAHMRFYGEFRWHKRSEEYYILDTTHPAAFAWLREVFRTWREEWGCEYFKTDFMHFGSEYGPDRAVWDTPGLTRIEIWRRTAEMIRATIGDALWVGCGCPLWASVGLVDGVRIGRDIGVEWKGNYSAQSLLRDQATRNFGHGILWQADPDCILLRQRFHFLADREVQALALYAGMTGGVAMTSDALDELPTDRLRLWQLILSAGAGGCRFPLLGRMTEDGLNLDPVLVQVRTNDRGDAAVLVFNPTDETQRREYSLSEMGFAQPLYAREWPGGVPFAANAVSQLSVALAAHGSVLFLLSASPQKDVTLP